MSVENFVGGLALLLSGALLALLVKHQTGRVVIAVSCVVVGAYALGYYWGSESGTRAYSANIHVLRLASIPMTEASELHEVLAKISDSDIRPRRSTWLYFVSFALLVGGVGYLWVRWGLWIAQLQLERRMFSKTEARENPDQQSEQTGD